MPHLTEPEVYDRLRQAIGEAVDAAKNLAIRSQHGRAYVSLRDNLHLIEGCCRQMAAFRGDGRWLPIGMMMAECHKRAGGWLRGDTNPVTQTRVATAPGEMNKLFVMLAANLANFGLVAQKLYEDKTGRPGPILPLTPAETRREGRPAFGRKSSLILPARFG